MGFRVILGPTFEVKILLTRIDSGTFIYYRFGGNLLKYNLIVNCRFLKASVRNIAIFKY